MYTNYQVAWLEAFALTLAFELPFTWWLFRRMEPSFFRRSALAFFANLASHPAVWFILPALPFGYWVRVAISEAWAVGSETVFFWLVFKPVRWRYAGAVALAANALSFAVGLAWYYWVEGR